MTSKRTVKIERMIKSMLPTLSRDEESFLSCLPKSYQIEVPYIAQKEMHWSGAAALQMIASFWGIDLGSQEQIVKEAEWDDWRSFDHSTFREKIARYTIKKGFLYSQYYPAGHIAPKMKDGIKATDFIRGNVEAIIDIDNQYLKALLVSIEAPVFVRIHFTTSDYHMSEEMANRLDFSGHAILVVGYNEKGFIVHDPWNKNEWGGILGGPDVFLSNELLASKNMLVDCTLDYMADVSLLQCKILPIKEAVYTGKKEVALQVICKWPGVKGILGDWYKLENINARLVLPSNMFCENERMSMGEKNLCPGEDITFNWRINVGKNAGSFPVQCELSGIINYPEVPWEKHSTKDVGEIKTVVNARICVFEKEFLFKFGRS